MTRKGLVYCALIAALALGAGYWGGLRAGARRAASAAHLEATSRGTQGPTHAPLPAAPTERGRAEGGTGEQAEPEHPSLAEIEAMVQSLRQGNQRGWLAWQRVIQSIAPADIAEVLGFVEKNPSKGARDGMRYSLLSRWAGADPMAAMTYANAVRGNREQERAVMAVLSGWAENEPGAAAAWAQQLPPGGLHNQAVAAAIGWLAATNPTAAFGLLQSSGRGPRQVGSVYPIFAAWTERDPNAAVAKAEELPAGQQRSQAFQAIAAAWGGKDPAAALAWAN